MPVEMRYRLSSTGSNRLSSKAHAGRTLGLILSLLAIPVPALAESLESEAVALRAKCLSSAAALRSLDLSSSVSLERLNAAGQFAGAGVESRERARWSKTRRKLKWSRPAGDPVAYLTDVAARTLTTAFASGTTYTEPLPPDQAEAMGTPFPAWLWRPEGLIPAVPAQVREEAGALVLVSSRTAPSREIWLDRNTGCLVRFAETDATGRVVRIVTVSGWAKESGVWMPKVVDDVIQGSENGLHRVVRFDRPVVNPPLGDSDFQVP